VEDGADRISGRGHLPSKINTSSTLQYSQNLVSDKFPPERRYFESANVSRIECKKTPLQQLQKGLFQRRLKIFTRQENEFVDSFSNKNNFFS
jgi:hypothetical protein